MDSVKISRDSYAFRLSYPLLIGSKVLKLPQYSYFDSLLIVIGFSLDVLVLLLSLDLYYLSFINNHGDLGRY